MDKFLKVLKTELLTKLNVVATSILLWIVSQPNAPTDKVLEYFPTEWHSVITLLLPVAWAVLVQFAIGKLKRDTEEKVLDKLVNEPNVIR